MRVTLDQFFNKIGIEATLRPYETIPFDYFNPDKGLDIMADVSLSGDGNLISMEIQQIEQPPNNGKMIFRQVLQMQMERESADIYKAKSLRYNGTQLAGKRRNWFDDGCRFIKQSIALIRKGTIPDFDSIYRTTLDENEGSVSGAGGSGGRSLRGDKLPKPGQTGRF